MKTDDFLSVLGLDFYTGVPDSKLRALCDTLMDRYGLDSKHHIIAANEGNAAAIAAGYHLATSKIPLVYLQNSGLGNIVNPVASLLHPDVYAIPVCFVIGWRGEPDLHDEPQHMVQGAITLQLLDTLQIPYAVLDGSTTLDELQTIWQSFKQAFEEGRSAAFVVKKGGLTRDTKRGYKNSHTLLREDVLRTILQYTGDDPILCTTGKSSRELYELREQVGQDHSRDFLTVGSMGHTSSIALGYSLHTNSKHVWCIDGDGAVLMHMGAIPVIGFHGPKNFIHIILNNGAHESVGGIPTVASNLTLTTFSVAAKYKQVLRVETMERLKKALAELINEVDGPSLLEVCVAIGARSDLGRPKTTPRQNKYVFMAQGLR